MNLRRNLEDRGVMSPYLLPHYFYRQDGLLLWDIIKKFVRTMLMLHYWTNQNVQSDEEIQVSIVQGWTQEFEKEGRGYTKLPKSVAPWHDSRRSEISLEFFISF